MAEYLACSADPALDAGRVMDAIDGLRREDLVQGGYERFLMAYKVMFFGTRRMSEIEALAEKAARVRMWSIWDYNRRRVSQMRTDATPVETPLPLEGAKSCLDRGESAILASFSLGGYRGLVPDLVGSGYDAAFLVANDAYRTYARRKAMNPSLHLWRHLRLIDVEAPSGGVDIVRTMRRGGSVIGAIIDGNTGMGGPLADASRVTLELFGRTVAVKAGLFDLAGRYGRSVLTGVCVPRTTRGDYPTSYAFIAGPVIRPDAPKRGDALTRFVEASARTVYAWFEGLALQYPEHWGDGRYLYRWLKPDPVAADLPFGAARAALKNHLASGGRLAVDEARVVQLPGRGETIWTDMTTMRSVGVPHEAAAIFKSDGADAGHGGDRDVDRLASLYARGMIKLCERGRGQSATPA